MSILRKFFPILAKSNSHLNLLMEDAMQNSKNYQKVIEAAFNHWVSPECNISGIQTWAEYSSGT